MSLELDEYQHISGSTAIYPRDTEASALSYVTLGLVGEAGELANKVKKILRDSGGVVSAEVKKDLAAESGDVLWYLAQLATEIGYELSEIAWGNLEKLQARAERGTLQGSGDHR